MKRSAAILSAALLLIGNLHGFAQGFLNLNFEKITIITNQYPGGDTYNAIISSWTSYINKQEIPADQVIFNDQTLDEPWVTIQGTNSTIYSPIPLPVQGKYTAYLLGPSMHAFGTNSAIGQVGQIPTMAASLVFWGQIANTTLVTFAGNPLTVNTIGSTANYTIYGAAISPYAGQTGELLFTTTGRAILDNIQFSTTPVPEPSTLALAALGILLFGYRRAKT